MSMFISMTGAPFTNKISYTIGSEEMVSKELLIIFTLLVLTCLIKMIH